MAKRICKVDLDLTTVSGSLPKRQKEEFYTLCELADEVPAKLIGRLVTEWCVEFKTNIKCGTKDKEEIATATEKQLHYIKNLCADAGEEFHAEKYKTYVDADAEIRRLLGK